MMKKKTIGWATGLLLVTVAALAVVSATHVDPEKKDGNPTCKDFEPEGVDWTEFKIEPVESGDYSDGTLNVTLDVDRSHFDWESNLGVSAVVVKGGPNANLYEYTPPATEDDGLHAPINPANDRPFGLSHVSFCYVEPEEPEEPKEPECPSEFDAMVLRNGDVKLTWVPGEDAPGYRIFRQVEDGPFMEIAALRGHVDEFIDDNTTAGTTYTYVITLLDEQGQVVERCARDTVTVPEEPKEPECPEDFKATALEDGSVQLSWTPDEGSEGFSLFRRESGGSFQKIADLPGNATGYTDTDTEVGVTYEYALALTDSEGRVLERCGVVEVTTIPVFPTALATVAAVGLSGLGYALVRRRK